MSTTSLQRILVPTDLSDFAAGAIRWAALLQRRLGGRITVLYANQPYVPFDIMEGPAAYALQTSVEFHDRLARDLQRMSSATCPMPATPSRRASSTRPPHRQFSKQRTPGTPT